MRADALGAGDRCRDREAREVEEVAVLGGATIAHVGRSPAREPSGCLGEAGRVPLEPDVLPHERLQRLAVDGLRALDTVGVHDPVAVRPCG